MSEYQYYEFQAIDRPLSADQQAQVAMLSSRVHVIAHMASLGTHLANDHGSLLTSVLLGSDFGQH